MITEMVWYDIALGSFGIFSSGISAVEGVRKDGRQHVVDGYWHEVTM